MTLGCAASEQVPGAGEGALTQHLERKCGFSRGKGVLVAGAQAECGEGAPRHREGMHGAGARVAVSFECGLRKCKD